MKPNRPNTRCIVARLVITTYQTLDAGMTRSEDVVYTEDRKQVVIAALEGKRTYKLVDGEWKSTVISVRMGGEEILLGRDTKKFPDWRDPMWKPGLTDDPGP